MQSAKDLKDSIESIEGNKFSFELEWN
jgi:hypothetical protein